MSDRGDSGGRRPGRNTTYQAEAYQAEDDLPPIEPQDLMDPDATGARIEGEIDGFHQPTAMFDKGQFLGELAELQDGGPDTRAAAETVEPPKGCRLIIVAGPDLGLEWSFKQPEIVIGRDEDCQLVISDIAVSRKHSKITLERGRFLLTDLGSGNGTWLNGDRVNGSVELSPGDEIVIGERTLRFVELNEAPATAAAHPVPPGGPEPLVGDPSLLGEDEEESFRPLGRRSQVDVGAVPPKDEPHVTSTKQIPKAADAPPPQGAALKTTATVLAMIAVLLAVGVGGWLLWERSRAEETEQERLTRSKREFVQGVELVKAKRCGDALVLFSRVLAVRPDYARAAEYVTYCKKEIGIWKQLEGAKELAASGRLTVAIEQLEGVPPESQYVEDAERLKERFRTAIAKRLVEEARRLYEDKEYERALDLVARALEHSPNLQAARDLLDLIEAAVANKPPPRKKRDKNPIPPLMMRAVALYKNGQIGPAIDAAEAVGGKEADTYVARMKRVKKLLSEAEQAHRQKAAGDLLRIAPAALEIDRQISGGDGKVHARLESMYANGLYLKGVSASAERDHVNAYRLFRDALRVKPSHKLAKSRLHDLDKQAEEIYFQGYVLKDSNKAETRKIFKKLTQMTPASNQYHQKAARWLKANNG